MQNSNYKAPVLSNLGSVAELTELSTYYKGGSGGDQFAMEAYVSRGDK